MFVRKYRLLYGQSASVSTIKECASLQTELAHSLVEWPAGVFAGHGAESNDIPLWRLFAISGPSDTWNLIAIGKFTLVIVDTVTASTLLLLMQSNLNFQLKHYVPTIVLPFSDINSKFEISIVK